MTDLPFTTSQAETVLSAWLGKPVACARIQRLHGGMINSVLRLDFNHEPFSAVIKLNRPGYSFQEEANALNYLHTHTRFPCPRVYLEDGSSFRIPYTFLLLETIAGVSMDSASLSTTDHEELDLQLANILMELHTHTRPTFGGVDDPGHERWLDIFLPRLVGTRSEPVIEQRLSQEVLANTDYAIRAAGTILLDQGQPTLIHGDIWAANILIQRNNGCWQITGLVDPGLQYADVEMELAYLEVFNTAHPTFFKAYTSHFPLRPGYDLRRLFYWLHTALIHVWLFGDPHYRDFTAQIASAIRNRLSLHE